MAARDAVKRMREITRKSLPKFREMRMVRFWRRFRRNNIHSMKHAYTYNLTVTDVAEHFALSPRTIRARLQSGDLDGVRTDGQWRLCWKDVFAAEQGPIPSEARLSDYKRPLLSKKGLGSEWKLSKRTIERMIAEGLPTRNVFGSVRIAPHDAEIWMRKRFNIPSARKNAKRRLQ